MINVFTQTDFDTSCETEVSLNHGEFSHPGTFLNQPTTHYSSIFFDAHDEFSHLQKDTLHVNYAHSDYLSSYTAIFPRQDPSTRMTNFIPDPIQPHSMLPHPSLPSSQKKKPVEKSRDWYIINIPWKNKIFPKLILLHIFLTELGNTKTVMDHNSPNL